jgi:hypothetical protein
MGDPSLAVITAVRNRSDHLQITAALLSSSHRHQEHLIVDWSSEPAVQRSSLPPDPRIRLVRVEGEQLWWHSRAYNHAIRLCTAEWILRCDADCLLQPDFFAALHLRSGTIQVATLPGGLCAETALERFGLLVAPRDALMAANGYEPRLVGWGYEDTDLLERLFIAGHAVAALPQVGVSSLQHSDCQRLGRRSLFPPRLALEASHHANRMMAQWCREHSVRVDLRDPGANCFIHLPPSQRDARQRALLAGALALYTGRYGRFLAIRAPLALVKALVWALGLDPLQPTPAAAYREPGRLRLDR